MEDKLNITIRIAELRPFAMEIRRSDEADIRNAEYRVNELWKAWKKRFNDRSSNDVLGMVAFQFAKAYILLSQRIDHANSVLEQFDKELDRILLDVGIAPDSDPTPMAD